MKSVFKEANHFEFQAGRLKGVERRFLRRVFLGYLKEEEEEVSAGLRCYI
jgi:hypothetical protein